MIQVVFLCSFVIGWFLPPSSVGVGDWDWVFSDAWLSATGFLERGWFPSWSIQIGGGAPLAGNPESLSYSPFLIFPLALGPIVGTKALVVLLIAAGVLGCHRLGLRWIGDPVGSAVFAFVFVFSGYFAIHFRAGHFPWAMFYLVPWVLLFTDRLLFDPALDPWDSVGLLVSLVLLFSGTVYHPLVYFLLPATVAYGAVNCRRVCLSHLRRILLLFLCAVGLTMPHWLAIIDWQWRIPRVVPRLGHGGMPLMHIGEMLFTPIADYKIRVPWSGSGVWEFWSYVGIVAGIVAIASVRSPRRSLLLARAFIVTAVILVWRSPWGCPLDWIAPYVPFLSSVRAYSRFLVLAVFGVALLAGESVGVLHSRLPRRFAWLPLLLLLAVAGDYWLVVRPIWAKVFALPLAEVYPDWGVTLEGAPYATIRSVPPVQDFTDNEDGFNSRMLPLLMAGAVVRNPYVSETLPWMRLREGRVVEDLSESNYRLTNHRLEFWGNFHEGQEIKINLRYRKSHWKVTDRRCARIQKDAGGIKLVILKPCQHIVISTRDGLEIVGWVITVIGLSGALAAILSPSARSPASSAKGPGSGPGEKPWLG